MQQPTAAAPQDLAAALRNRAVPLTAPDDPGFGRAVDCRADRRVILRGEASHGAAQFHRARGAIPVHLIRDHGGSILALEAGRRGAAEWNRLVRGRPIGCDWLHGRTRDHPGRQTGFCRLELHSLHGSIRAVLDCLVRSDPTAAAPAREGYACLQSWPRAAATVPPDARLRCDCREFPKRRIRSAPRDPDAFLAAAQNARSIAPAGPTLGRPGLARRNLGR